MPTSITDTLRDNRNAGRTKSTQAHDLPRYLFSAALAGAFVGIAVVLLLSVGAPLVAAGSPLAKLAMGAVFGVALTLVVFAGGELVTGNMMVMTQSAIARTVTWPRAVLVCVAALAGNLVGSVALALAVHGSGTFTSGPGAELVASTVAAKDAARRPAAVLASGAVQRPGVPRPLDGSEDEVRYCEAGRRVVGPARVHRVGLRALGREHDDVLDRSTPRVGRLVDAGPQPVVDGAGQPGRWGTAGRRRLRVARARAPERPGRRERVRPRPRRRS
ncbi:MAG: formate/nitrite transporter family protein [Microthrixaceae bacterium]